MFAVGLFTYYVDQRSEFFLALPLRLGKRRKTFLTGNSNLGEFLIGLLL